MESSYWFFWTNAGTSYHPATETEGEGRARGARELAEAETWAQSVGMTFMWHDDDLSTDQYQPEVGQTWEVASAWVNGECVASLCGIEGATSEYRRVVEAELAMEARERVESEIEAAHKLVERTNRKRELATELQSDSWLETGGFIKAARELAWLVLEDLPK
jgi:hypothetical protein